MPSPYGLKIIESCLGCTSRAPRFFCNLSVPALQAFEAIRFTNNYPRGSLLFLEGQPPRGVFVLCRGRVKLFTSSRDGKTVILRIAEPGEVLGLSASMSGRPYSVTAESIEPCQVNFVKREDFQRFLREHNEVCLRAAQELSEKYNSACREIRSLGLSHSAGEKLGRFLLEYSSRNGQAGERSRLKIGFTHEEIAEMIGTSRETVTRLLAELKRRQIVQVTGATLLICDRGALERLAA